MFDKKILCKKYFPLEFINLIRNVLYIQKFKMGIDILQNQDFLFDMTITHEYFH